MRVLHVVHDFLPRDRAGVELYVFHLARAQRAGGVDARVLAGAHAPGRPPGERAERTYRGVLVVDQANDWAAASVEDAYRWPALRAPVARILAELRGGLLYPPTSVAGLAAALERLLAEPGLGPRLAAAAPPVRSIAADASDWAETYAAAGAPAARAGAPT